MAIFIMLSRLSPEGMQTLRNNPERIQEVNREIEGFGARVVQQYALLGPYDFITVLEAPDPETVARVSVELSSRATASYETLAAVPVEGFISRIRGEREDAQRAQQGTAESASNGERSEDTTTPRTSSIEEIAPPPRTEEASPRRAETSPRTEPAGTFPPGTEEAPPRAEEEASRREEDRSFLDRAREARSGQDLDRARESLSAQEESRGEEPEPRRAPPRGLRGDEPLTEREESARQPEREQEEREGDDRGLIERARDALLGEEEPPRRREGTDRPEDRR